MGGKVAYNDLAAGATATASSETATFEKENAVDHSPASKWRTTGLTENIVYDLGAAQTIKAVFAGGTDMVSGDTTWRIRAGTTAACTDWNTSAGDLTKGPKSYLEINQTYRYFMFDIVAVGGTYRQFGKLCLFSDLYEFPWNYLADHGTGTEDVNHIIQGLKGSRRKVLDFQRQIRSLRFQKIDQAQFLVLDKIIRPLTECVFYDDRQSEAYYGTPELARGAQASRADRNDMLFNFTEAL